MRTELPSTPSSPRRALLPRLPPAVRRFRAGPVGILLFLVLLGRGEAGAASIAYGYDAAGRLVAAGTGAGRSTTYAYDAGGNLLLRAVVEFTDSDLDRMEDSWERRYFKDLARDGRGDFDGDGQVDLDEFLAGTDPTDAVSALAFAGDPRVSGEGVRLEWKAVPNRRYRVQYRDSLGAGGWNDLPGDVTALSDRASKVDAAAPDRPWRFYRVLALP